MRNIIPVCTAFLMFTAFSTHAASDVDPGSDKFPSANASASFAGGEVKLAEYIQEHFNYPEIARQYGIEGEVKISFFVLADGSLHGARIVKGINAVCDQAALKAISAMPKWTPARKDGKPMASKNHLTLRFSLEN